MTCERLKVTGKVSKSNKLSLDPAYNLPNYVVNVFQSHQEIVGILGFNFRGHAISLFKMGITMVKNLNNKKKFCFGI